MWSMKIIVFWYVSCSPVEIERRSRGFYDMHRASCWFTLTIEVVSASETSVKFYQKTLRTSRKAVVFVHYRVRLIRSCGCHLRHCYVDCLRQEEVLFHGTSRENWRAWTIEELMNEYEKKAHSRRRWHQALAEVNCTEAETPGASVPLRRSSHIA